MMKKAFNSAKHPEGNMKKDGFFKSDRTTLNRRNSAFRPFITVNKSEKFRFLAVCFALFFYCYCSILIVLKDLSSSSKNRTRPGTLFNTVKNRKNSDSVNIRTARILNFNPKSAKFLLYSLNGTRARRKKFKPSLPLIRFLRSLDALYFFPQEVSQ